MLVMTLDNPVQNLTTKVWARRLGRGGGGRYPQFSWYLQASVKATLFEGSETFIVFSLLLEAQAVLHCVSRSAWEGSEMWAWGIRD